MSPTQSMAIVPQVAWPLEGANAGRTRATAESIPPPLSVGERYVVGGDTQFVSPIVTTSELLIADGDRRLHAFDLASNEESWRVVLPGSFLSPTIVDDTVYIRVESGDDGFIVALDSHSGEERWNYRFPQVGSSYGDIGGHVTAPLVVDGLLFAAAARTLNAFDSNTGEIVWQFESSEPVAASVGVANGIVYLADFTHLYALDQNTGSQRWQFDHEAMTLFFAPVVTEEAIIVADHFTIYALEPTEGHILWQQTFDQEVIPAAAHADEIYVKTVNQLFALNSRSGKPVWHYAAVNFVSLPAVTQDHVYMITRSDGGSQLRALRRRDGVEVWKMDEPLLGNSAPVAAFGAIYVRTTNGGIIGYRP